ncbi:hypothetical protein DPMN_089009 [Dreissena polymorpha]|uniref:Uncharacterized protein n=1 Tax=Dreissena polymorpha TaxID=45954 RepID=A0A9D4QXT6_DREPO|nr:hypothetical protein DPMN_089009 [Dreissena polymorpha]
MQQKYPVELWTTLDWNKAIHNELAFLNWEGCPINLDKGTHFMGQGVISDFIASIQENID